MYRCLYVYKFKIKFDLNTSKSAYHPGHNTETAFLKIVDCLFLSLYKRNMSMLSLLDFSSASDKIDRHPCMPSLC